jgi:hypothetical protein
MKTGPLEVDNELLHKASTRLRETMVLGRIPLIVMGAGMSAGVLAPTMREIHKYLSDQINALAISRTPNDPEHVLLIGTIKTLLKHLSDESVPDGWPEDEFLASPRSVQVRLYHLLQTSRFAEIRELWDGFGKALLLRSMVTRTNPLIPKEHTLADLLPSRAHVWAAFLAMTGQSVVASLNYDGLTRKAINKFSHYVLKNRPEGRQTCRILTSAEEIHGFFTGTEAGVVQNLERNSWQPIPVIKFRGDVFHAICRNTRCPEANKATPLYFVLPTSSDEHDSNETKRQLDQEIRCKCCKHPRQLEISFPGVFDKELQIDNSLSAFHRYFGSRLAGIVFLGFSGSWDESLVGYTARRAKALGVPIISLSAEPTPSIRQAAAKHKVEYFYIPYLSLPLPSGGHFEDSTLEALIPIADALAPSSSAPAKSDAALPNGSSLSMVLSFPKDMLGQLADGASVNSFQVKETDNSDLNTALYDAGRKSEVFLRLRSCSQLGIKGILLREDAPSQHTRYHHSSSAMVIGRVWYETLRAQLRGTQCWGSTEEARIAFEQAVLFHDARHLPFSHMMEEIFRELNWGHRPSLAAPSIPRYTSKDSPKPEELDQALSPLLESIGLPDQGVANWWHKVRTIQDGRTGITWMEAIVDSALDADKIEYIFNDTKLTGQNVRLAECSGWLSAFLSGQRLTPEGLIRLEGESCFAALELLQERAHLYRTLYLAPELRGLECLARYIVQTWLTWKLLDAFDFEKLMSRASSDGFDLRSEKSEKAGELLWNLFRSGGTNSRPGSSPLDELGGLEIMVDELIEGDAKQYLDEAAQEWIKRLWWHLEAFQIKPPHCRPNIRDSRRAFERLSPRGPLYMHRRHEKQLRDIARRWRVHYPLLGLLDLAPFPSFLATPRDRSETVGGKLSVADHFLVPGTNPNEWRRRARATTPLHQCDFEHLSYPVIQVLVLDPFGDSSGGAAFLDEMLRRELQQSGILHYESPEAVPRNEG